LNKLLALYNRGEKDFLSAFDETALVKTQDTGAIGEKPKKHFSIPDYITCSHASYNNDEEVLVATAGGKLTFKSSAYKKVEVHNVMVGQWIAANSWIFDILAPAMSFSQTLAYNEYVKMVGDYFDLYTTASVMVLDEEHRRHVNFSGRAWDDDSLHFERLHLKIKGSHVSVTPSVESVAAGVGPVVSKKP
jgi:hypothetical protein